MIGAGCLIEVHPPSCPPAELAENDATNPFGFGEKRSVPACVSKCPGVSSSPRAEGTGGFRHPRGSLSALGDSKGAHVTLFPTLSHIITLSKLWGNGQATGQDNGKLEKNKQ